MFILDHNCWTRNARKSIKGSKDSDSSIVSIKTLLYFTHLFIIHLLITIKTLNCAEHRQYLLQKLETFLFIRVVAETSLHNNSNSTLCNNYYFFKQCIALPNHKFAVNVIKKANKNCTFVILNNRLVCTTDELFDSLSSSIKAYPN